MNTETGPITSLSLRETGSNTSLLSVRDILHLIFKRKTWILVFFGITVSTVAYYSLSTEHTYMATGQLLVKVGRESIYMATPTQSPLILNRGDQISSEIEVLKSRHLAGAVVESLGPATIYEGLDQPPPQGLLDRLFQRVFQTPDPTPPPREVQTLIAEDNVLANLSVQPVGESNVISVSFVHRDRRMAATVVNTLMNHYLDRHLEVHKTPQSTAFFREQSQIWENKLQQAQDRLETFKKEHDLTADLQEERSLILGQEANLRSALNETMSLEAATEDRLRNPDQDAGLLSRLVELELKEQEFLAKYTDESRFVKGVRDEIKVVRRALAGQQSTRYQAEMNALKARKESQRAQLAEYQKKLEELKRIETKFSHFTDEVMVTRQNYQLYLTKLEESRVSDAMDTERIASVKVIEPAKPPRRPEPRNVARNMVLGILLGGLGGLGLAFFSESLNNSLEKIEDVENHLQLPVLASIPQLEQKLYKE